MFTAKEQRREGSTHTALPKRIEKEPILGGYWSNTSSINGVVGGNFSSTNIITVSTANTRIFFRGNARNGNMTYTDDANGHTKGQLSEGDALMVMHDLPLGGGVMRKRSSIFKKADALLEAIHTSQAAGFRQIKLTSP